jgi:hypothetical protein
MIGDAIVTQFPRVERSTHRGGARCLTPLLLVLALAACDKQADKQAEGGEQNKPETAEDKARREDNFAMTLVKDYTGCFAKFEVNGAVDGRLVMVIDSSGAVAGASFQGKDPEPVQKCLVDLVRGRSIDKYEGEPGLAMFSYSGSYSNGIENLSESWGFKRRAVLSAEQQQQLDEALGGGAAEAEEPGAEEPGAGEG